ncbi:MAG TPA: hypothetical protein PKC43_03065 [Phycisphaerales bacterium]|nr:hypothetical protein [Phycisphaerales bacterium]HMP36408.1 hypothetical protein [Phycisphaerales bacterium]
MARKFLSLPSEKQRIVALEVARVRAGGESRGVAVASERGRLTLFSSRRDGEWAAWSRDHDLLDRTPRPPNAIERSGWSGRIGVAAVDDGVALVYRRRIRASNRGGLWVERLRYDSAHDAFAPESETPMQVPRGGLGVDRYGAALWAAARDGSLLLVVQAWLAGDVTAPRLVLLRAAFDADLAAAASWSLHDLDAGGHDLDARLDGTRLRIIHRRRPGALAVDLPLPLDPGFAPSIELHLSDLPGAPLPIRPLVAPLALLEFDVAASSVIAIEEDLPGGEHPRFVGAADAPTTYTADRWSAVSTLLRLVDGAPTVEFIELHRMKSIATRFEGRWRQGDLMPLPRRLPRSLAELARADRLVGIGPSRTAHLQLELGTLLAPWPCLHLDELAAEKGRRLALAHHDPRIGALVATTVDLLPAGEHGLAATPVGVAILDINRSALSDDFAPGERIPENRQFRPFAQRDLHAQDPPPLRIVEPGPTSNTLGASLAVASDDPSTFFAAVDGGDGGGRAYLDAGLSPAPTTLPDPKQLHPAMVVSTLPAEARWVSIETAGRMPARLAGYHWNPFRSLGSSLQQALDGLGTVIGMLELPADGALDGGGRVVRRDDSERDRFGRFSRIELRRATADALQPAVLALAGAPAQAESPGDAPFRAIVTRTPAVVYVGAPIEFAASLPSPPTGTASFAWEFLRDTAQGTQEVFMTGEGSAITVQFPQATLPDRSIPGPQAEGSRLVARLTVTVTDGSSTLTTTVESAFPVSAGLWADLWAGFGSFRRVPNNAFDPSGEAPMAPGFETRLAIVELFKYRIRYRTDAGFVGDAMEIDFLTEHDTLMRFRQGDGPSQGFVELHARLRSTLPGDASSGEPAIFLTGTLGGVFASVAEVRRLETELRLVRGFTPGTTTSELRDGASGSEVVVEARGFGGRAPIPSALACKPATPLRVEIDRVEPIVRLSLAAWVSGAVVGAIVALGLAGPAMAASAPLLIALGIGLGGLIAAALLGVVIAIIVGAGLGLLLLLLFERFVFAPWVEGIIRDQIGAALTAEAFAEQGMLLHAGEGLAEALAAMLLDRAIAEGAAIAPPQRLGRDRFRRQCFESVVVTEGRCAARIWTGSGT